MALVDFSNVSFHYPVIDPSARSLKLDLINQIVGARIGRRKDGQVMVSALSDVSFRLQDGDRLGLVGRNGSGKSTILRLAAGVVRPTRGQLTRKGRVVSLIERGLGLQPDLSGRANIDLPLRLLGASDVEVRRARAEIPEWTGLGGFIDLPVRTYSEGMRARLLFAICTALDSDILILDEWMGAGDAEFMERAQERITGMLARTSILILASHSPDAIQRTCTTAAWMDRGKLAKIGAPDAVIGAYLDRVHRTESPALV